MPAEITQADAVRRARLLQVRSYHVALDLTEGDRVFRSACTVRFDCAEPGPGTHADLIAETVHEIILNGVSLDPAATCADGRITLTGLAASNELRVVADCAYTRSGTGMHRTVDSADGKVYLYAKCQPAYARTVYACFDQPDLKAAFTFHVTAPAHWTVRSNQPAPEPVPAGEHTAVWHFPPTPRLPTYLTTVVAGDYRVVTGEHTAADGRRIDLEIACRASLASHLEPDAVFEVTRQGLGFYPALLGTGYPFAKYGQVFVPEFSAGATENVGCVLIGEQFLFRSRVTAALRELRAMVILHEMAHMWFGGLVTMRWWDDLWLSESFAEFCGHLATAEAAGFTGAWVTFSVRRKRWAYFADRLPSSHPVAAAAPTLSAAIANFDGISYAKGASVLRQLAAYVGRPAFFSAVRGYFAAHGWGNATRADFLQAVAASSGMDLDDWAKAWLETAGPTILRGEFATSAGGAITEFAVCQEPAGPQRVWRPHHVAVGLYRRSGGRLRRTHRVTVDVTGARAAVPELSGVDQPDLILLNDDDAGYAIIRLDPRSLRTVTESVGDLTDPVARAVCWNAVLDLVWQAELGVPAFVTMLAAGLPAEPLVPVLTSLSTLAEQAMVQLADPAWVPAGKERLAGVAAGMLAAAEPGSDHQLAWAQLLSWTATSADQLDLVASLLDGSVVIDGLPVTVDLRWSLLQRLAATGRAGDAAIDTELAADATDAGRRSAAACRAAMPDAGHKEAAWQSLTRGRLGVQTLIAVARGFSQPEQASLLTPYAGRYLAVLPQIWQSGSSHLRVLLGELLLPYPAASPELLAGIEQLLSASQPEPGLARVLAERRDMVRRALRSRALTVPPSGSRGA